MNGKEQKKQDKCFLRKLIWAKPQSRANGILIGHALWSRVSHKFSNIVWRHSFLSGFKKNLASVATEKLTNNRAYSDYGCEFNTVLLQCWPVYPNVDQLFDRRSDQLPKNTGQIWNLPDEHVDLDIKRSISVVWSSFPSRREVATVRCAFAIARLKYPSIDI